MIKINEKDAAPLSAAPPVEALPRPSRVPLSFRQQRLWILSHLADGSEPRHIQMGLRLRGDLDEAALQSALDGLVARHEVLRTTFGVQDGEPFQRIGPAKVGLPLKRNDLTAADAEPALSELIRHEAKAAFNLEVGPVIRGRLVCLGVEDHVLLITMHHMVSDDWSRTILTREFSELYAAAREGRADRLTSLPVQYADYALWQRRWLAGEVLKCQADYWRQILAGAQPMLVPTDWPRPAQQYQSGNFVEFVLHKPLTAQLKALSRCHGTTLFVTLLAGWALVLARLSGQDDLVIGTPSANRTRSEVAGLIGLFVDTLALRIDLSDDPTLEKLLERVNAAALGAQANQELPFGQVVELVNSPISHIPIFQVILAWQNCGAEAAKLPGLELEHVRIDDRVAEHDLALELAEVGEAIRGRLIYATSLFERSTVERFVEYLQQALSQIAADSGQRAWSAALLLAEERDRRVVEPPINAAHPQDPCIQGLSEAQEERDPEAHAVIYDGLSYRDRNVGATSATTDVWPPQSSPTNPGPGPGTAVMNFIEGTRVVTEGELQANSVTRYHVAQFYRQQITNSGYYDQLKYIVEPSFEEFESPGNLDTSGEHDNTVVPGLQHKYPQTGLLLVTDRCVSYCRFCFRKRIVGKDSDEIAPDFTQIARYIGNHPEMTNVLLSGGDPFVLSTAKLDKIVDHLLPIPHLNSIRFGTKALAYEPRRFEDPALPALFQRIHEAGKAAVIVTHFDHIGEISVDAERNIRSLRARGVQFLNQAVLLAKVNDDPDVLASTFAKCHHIGVRPYYLFQARPVKGASHFQVSLRRGLEISHGINQRLSGIQKTFKFIMSHYTGKIEIIDLGADGRVYMRYHQNKIPEKIGKIFSRPHLDGSCWLDDLPEG
ncbi:condensation domain-containing protein [Mesorhizobium sp.]|uniref:condensation domain-containing protein n=1 Tax=Mesorhizobium sp. TaxID=1871066 RepID=UPI0026000E29|nr:condensation domain-containing protein [Mesorhizobium sp.]